MNNTIIYAAISAFILTSVGFTAKYFLTVKSGYAYLTNSLKNLLNSLETGTISSVPDCLAGAWEEYTRVVNPEKTASYEAPETFFNVDLLLVETLENRETIKAFPGLLTSFGLLGTFVAILMSLFFLQIDPQTSEVQGIELLVTGLGAKFVSSIVALLLAIAFVLFERHEFSKLKRSGVRLCNRLRQIYPVLSTKQMLASLKDNEQNREKFLEDLSEKLQKNSIESMENMVNIFQQTLADSTVDQFNTIKNTVSELSMMITNVSNGQIEFAERMGTINEISAKMLENQKASAQTIEALMNASCEKVELFKKTVESCGSIITNISTVTSEIAYAGELFVEASPKLHSCEVSVNELNENLSSNIKVIKELTEGLQPEKIKAVADEFQANIKQSADMISGNLNKENNLINENLEAYSEKMNNFVSSLTESVQKLQGTLENYSKTAEELLKKPQIQKPEPLHFTTENKETAAVGAVTKEAPKFSLSGIWNIRSGHNQNNGESSNEQ